MTMRDVLKCVIITSGEKCVVAHGVDMMLIYSVSSWDTNLQVLNFS